MEASDIQKRLVAAALFAELPRPAIASGKFTIMVQTCGILIIYVFGVDNTPGPYTLDHIVTWRALAHGSANPIIQAMTRLIASAKDYKP